MRNTFTTSHTFNVAGKLYIAYSQRVENLLLTGEIHETSRIIELTKSGALIALTKSGALIALTK